MSRERNLIPSIVGAAIIGVFLLPAILDNQASAVSTPFALQDTKVSGPDPTPGHEDQHQAVNVIPQRNDTRIYTGTVTYTSSTPVEVIVTHPYNLTQTANVTTSMVPEPLIVPGQNIAISILHELGQGAQFDTIPFSGSSLQFHNRANQNFSVSYSVAGNLVDATGVPN